MLDLVSLSKRYPNGLLALEGLSLSVAPGEILAIVGGSGCGKSTLLRLISGLDAPTSGRASLDGTPLTAPRPEIGMVFQEPRLMPWLSIDDNVGFGIRHLPASEQKSRINEALARVGLASHAGHWPRELSGGQAQRVALARALVGRPQVLLLDEPFSALDALTRADLQDHLLELWHYDRPTMILVTHDIEEALVLADRIVVMQPNPGRIRVEVTPHLARPRDRLDHEFQEWKYKLLAELDHASRPPGGEELSPAAAI
ncbi:nitrate/sulfonate/bicarbonate ABC transporter ATP-binding protein [Paramagnetospirillum marisnigri]|uniref:Nitrate/sulfonate/bicarbonate ABC transporter ATP-binding protein n=1 Tax=Paramagnetospirillum marisnigri TaxID=1285242 RepID=A0A178MAB3_9PROT|nr:ABC transporter ATP-binding protein [Paramagnetospirillum marisnigri]OAN45689.1 nitrate/sulfonate/bicarbonate ABC transporter ATP-binding protein [Paramagnetospirillum marisnigri]OAN45711.1 nitrate/sulfonate/bicarbonate ABC transporter ATP-binding protein [Paramagnetospirillum marisnigri]